MIENIFKDIRHALRVLGKSPGFTLAATLSLALGIGGTTMIFTVVNAVLLRPLPYHDSDRIVWVWSERSNSGVTERVSYPDFLDWKARSKNP
jgi:putative ABC transport system permease protein